jgi:glyoxylase-like metal-dependent hydrolase (beta-lactamase superfamily II)
VRINASVARIRWMVISNVYVVRTARGRTLLVDSGHPFERPTMLRELERMGIRPSAIDGVLLTHRHSDHAGNARFFQRHGVRIFCHQRDAEILAGRAPQPKIVRKGRGAMDLVAGFLGEFENRFPARLEVDRAFDDGEDIFGLEARWMPGHTEGSAFFMHHDSGALFSGDMLLSARPPLVVWPGLSMPEPRFSDDWDRARGSLRAFMSGPPAFTAFCAGHGKPLTKNASARVLEFLAAEMRDR